MVRIFLKNFLAFTLCLSLLMPSVVLAQSTPFELQELSLPSETKEMARQSGSIYYSTTSKNKTLMPIHFWGEVGRPGLHYIPIDSKLIKAISFAGGGTASADLEEIYINRVEDKKMVKHEFDLTQGGDITAHDFSLKPGDTVFVSRDTWRDNRAFYVSLVTLVVTVLSTVLIVRQIQNG